MRIGSLHIPKAVIAVGLIQSTAAVAGYVIGPIEVRFIESLTANSAFTGAVYAIGSVFFAILSVVLGRLSDRHGRRNMILAGLGLGVVYPILYATAANAYAYAGVRFFWAASAVTTGPVLFAYLQDLLEDHPNRGQILGYIMSIGAIVGSVAALSGGFLAEIFSLRAPYYASAALYVIALLLALAMLRPEGKRLRDRPKLEQRHPLHALHYIFKRPILIFYFIFNSAYSLNWGIKGLLWPLIIFGISGSDAMTGSIFATMGIVAFFVLLIAGKKVDMYHPIRAMFLSFGFLVGAGTVIVFTDSLSWLWVAAGVFAVGEAIQGPAQAVLLTDYVESHSRGEILGADAVFDNVLGTLSPLLAGFLLLAFTPQHVLGVYIAMLFISALGGYLLFSRKLRGYLVPVAE